MDLAGLKITIYIERDGNQEKPADKPSATDEPSTEAQQKAIYAISHAGGWKDYEVEKKMDELYHVTSSKQLTKKQASGFIEKLKAGS